MLQSILLVFSVFAFYGLSFLFVKKDRKFVFLFLSFIAVSLYVVLQKAIGADYYNYEKIYAKIAETPWASVFSIHLAVEPLFRLICKICILLGLNYPTFSRLYLLIAIMICFISFNRDSENALINVIVFIVFSLSWTLAYRQFMAFAIILWSFKFVKNKKIGFYLLAVAVATLLHISAIIAFLIYPVYNCEDHKLYRRAILVSTFIIIIFNQEIIKLLREVVALVDTRYQKYITNEGFSINMTMFMIGLLSILYLFLDRTDSLDNKAINMLLLCLFGFVCSALSNMVGRFMLYFFYLIGYSFDRLFDFSDNRLDYNNQEYMNKKIFIATRSRDRIIMSIVFILGLIAFWWYTELLDFRYISIFA